MSIYSDHKCGALSDEEFKRLVAIENRRERYYEEKASEELYWNDDDERDEVEDDG
jgi:hypothetical protein